MKKFNKGKAKRLAKYVSKENRSPSVKSADAYNLVQRKELNGVLTDAYGVSNDDPQSITAMALALTRLRFGVGDQEDMSLMYSRIMFGRRLAYNYFEDRITESLHHALQTVVLAAAAQFTDEGKAQRNVHLDGDEGIEISDALRVTEDMATKISRDQYQYQALIHQTEPATDPMLQLQDWETILSSGLFRYKDQSVSNFTKV